MTATQKAILGTLAATDLALFLVWLVLVLQ